MAPGRAFAITALIAALVLQVLGGLVALSRWEGPDEGKAQRLNDLVDELIALHSEVPAAKVSCCSIVLFLTFAFVVCWFGCKKGCKYVRMQPPCNDSCRLSDGSGNSFVFQSLTRNVARAPIPQSAGDIDPAIPEPEADADDKPEEKTDIFANEFMDEKASSMCKALIQQTAVLQAATPMRRRRSAEIGQD